MPRRHAVLSGLIFLLVVMITVWSLARSEAQTTTPADPTSGQPAREVRVNSVAALERLFGKLDYDWPIRPGQGVPPVIIHRLPADFTAIADTDRRKSLFVRAILPIAMAENRRLREQRALASLLANVPPTQLPEARLDWLRDISERYRIGWQPPLDPATRRRLMRRLDALPNSLVMVQAAIESGWGTSRFLQEGNGLFGQWTWVEGSGIVPRDRPEGASHEVKAFASLRDSLRAYLHNLNTGRPYRRLREIRWALRQRGEPLDPALLAAGLVQYSERGPAYVADVRRMLDTPPFQHLDSVSLRDAADLSIDG